MKRCSMGAAFCVLAYLGAGVTGGRVGTTQFGPWPPFVQGGRYSSPFGGRVGTTQLGPCPPLVQQYGGTPPAVQLGGGGRVGGGVGGGGT